MAAETPTKEPTQIRAGDTVTWKKTIDDYKANDGWTLNYSLRGNSEAITLVDGSFLRKNTTVTLTALLLLSDNPCQPVSVFSSPFRFGAATWDMAKDTDGRPILAADDWKTGKDRKEEASEAGRGKIFRIVLGLGLLVIAGWIYNR